VRTFQYAASPARVVFGLRASRERLVEAMEEIDAQRVLVLAAPPEADLARELSAPLGRRAVAMVTDVRPHVPVPAAEAARRAAADHGADTLLSVGGGSTTGTAKAVALTTGLPIVAIPTTYAGSEATPVYGLTDAGRKTTGTDPRVVPRIVIYDPQLTVTLPPRLSATSGLNALAHCAEAFWGPRANPISSLLAEEGIRALRAALPVVVEHPDDLDARSEALYGAWLAGTVFGQAGSGLHHKICHVLGGAYDLPHAALHSVVLPHAVAALAPRHADASARIAAALGAPDGTPAAEAIAALSRELGAPTSLQEIGLEEDRLDEATDLVSEHVSLERDATASLLAAAIHGTRPRPVTAATP
jgi:maleylacetate reductase